MELAPCQAGGLKIVTCGGVRVLFALMIGGNQILVQTARSRGEVRRLPQFANTTDPALQFPASGSVTVGSERLGRSPTD